MRDFIGIVPDFMVYVNNSGLLKIMRKFIKNQ